MLHERPCAIKVFHDDQPLQELLHELEAHLQDPGRTCCVAVLGVCLGDEGSADSMDVDCVPPALITDLMNMGGLHRKAWCAAAVCWGWEGRGWEGTASGAPRSRTSQRACTIPVLNPSLLSPPSAQVACGNLSSFAFSGLPPPLPPLPSLPAQGHQAGWRLRA